MTGKQVVMGKDHMNRSFCGVHFGQGNASQKALCVAKDAKNGFLYQFSEAATLEGWILLEVYSSSPVRRLGRSDEPQRVAWIASSEISLVSFLSSYIPCELMAHLHIHETKTCEDPHDWYYLSIVPHTVYVYFLWKQFRAIHHDVISSEVVGTCICTYVHRYCDVTTKFHTRRSRGHNLTLSSISGVFHGSIPFRIHLSACRHTSLNTHWHSKINEAVLYLSTNLYPLLISISGACHLGPHYWWPNILMHWLQIKSLKLIWPFFSGCSISKRVVMN